MYLLVNNCFIYSHRIGTFGYIAEYGAEKKVTKYSSVFASVAIGVPTGVTLKIKYDMKSEAQPNRVNHN